MKLQTQIESEYIKISYVYKCITFKKVQASSCLSQLNFYMTKSY